MEVRKQARNYSLVNQLKQFQRRLFCQRLQPLWPNKIALNSKAKQAAWEKKSMHQKENGTKNLLYARKKTPQKRSESKIGSTVILMVGDKRACKFLHAEKKNKSTGECTNDCS